jgi:hypothetical protein
MDTWLDFRKLDKSPLTVSQHMGKPPFDIVVTHSSKVIAAPTRNVSVQKHKMIVFL